MTDIESVRAAFQAERELDALVAEKVMGCKPITGPGGAYCGCGRTCDFPHGQSNEDGQLYGELANYSTDIGDAWNVVEYMWMRGWALTLTRRNHEPERRFWQAQLHDGAVTTISKEVSAPLAICHAALLAVDE